MTHVLQSDAWAAFQRTDGVDSVKASGEGWNALGLIEIGPMKTRRIYAPYGPSFTSEQALDAALTDLEGQARSNGAVFVRVEPVGADADAEHDAAAVLHRRGYHRVHHVQPEDTWLLGLEGDAESILKGIEGSKRRRYKSAAKRGVTIRVSHDPDDIHLLTGLLAKVEERNAVTMRDEQYLHEQAAALMPLGVASLYIASVDDESGQPQAIAASLVYDFEDTRYYAHSGSDYEYRRLGPNVVLLVQMILDAQAEGKKWFDFYGIAPEGAPEDHPWAGFTAFKQSFGGQARHYLGAWEKPVRPLRYWIYETGRKLIAHK